MKTDPDLPSDIGPYKKQDVKPETEAKPAKARVGPPSAVNVLLWVLTALFWLMVLSPLFGLVLGFMVGTFVEFFNWAKDISTV